jgi:acyl carrier protein
VSVRFRRGEGELHDVLWSVLESYGIEPNVPRMEVIGARLDSLALVEALVELESATGLDLDDRSLGTIVTWQDLIDLALGGQSESTAPADRVR